MQKLHCHLICHSHSVHLSQIYAGFSMLWRQGHIELTQSCTQTNYVEPDKPQHLRDAKHAHLLVIVNNIIKIYYDTHDSFEIDANIANKVDYYFKRSYLSKTAYAHVTARVLPLGLNYQCYPHLQDVLERERVTALEPPAIRDIFLNRTHSHEFLPTVKNMVALPDKNLPAKIVLMTRTWDPFDKPDRTPDKIEERKLLNEQRAHIINALQKTFKGRFMGGFAHNAYAVTHYKHLLLDHPDLANKKHYVEILKTYPIGVATTGLHQSIGWKMGEYVAYSRAILSEPLAYEVPHDFGDGKNYLSFNSLDTCLTQAEKLLSNDDLRFTIMENNRHYYLNYLRPDKLIENTLTVVLQENIF